MVASAHPWVAFPFRELSLAIAKVPAVNAWIRLDGLVGNLQ